LEQDASFVPLAHQVRHHARHGLGAGLDRHIEERLQPQEAPVSECNQGESFRLTRRFEDSEKSLESLSWGFNLSRDLEIHHEISRALAKS
jgi:hypothetical protein